MKFFLIYIIALTTLISCTHSGGKRLYLIIDRVDGLQEGSSLQSNGLQLGKIYDMDLYKNMVMVRLQVDRKFKIPKGSLFKLGTPLLSSDACIEVLRSDSTAFYADGDTAIAIATPANPVDRALGRIVDSTMIK
jgi:ABC-type transporter Mla subunit MlaD